MAAITKNTYQVLMALMRSKYAEVKGQYVIQATGINAAAVGKVLDHLIKVGLVKLVPTGPEDGLNKYYALSKQGIALVKRLSIASKALASPTAAS